MNGLNSSSFDVGSDGPSVSEKKTKQNKIKINESSERNQVIKFKFKLPSSKFKAGSIFGVKNAMSRFKK